MKPYFAKYLPIEGEIRKDSVVLYGPNNNHFSVEEVDNDIVILIGGGICSLKDCIRVKLFLCSRDIQVGDKVKIDGTYEEITIPSYMDEKGIFIMAKNKAWLKVIGEVSPEATWVKEGDEFDEEQIRWKTWNKYDYSLIPLNKIEWEDWNPKGEIFAILGPCNHFHYFW